MKEEDLKDIGHNQLKIDRRFIVNSINDLKKKSLVGNDISKKLLLKIESLTKSLSSFDKLNNIDLTQIPTKDLNYLYKELSALRIPIDIRFLQIKNVLKTDNEELQKDYSYVLPILTWSQELHFISLTIKICMLLTLRHTIITRYPQDNQNPLKIYTSKLSLIKKQLPFMDLLEEAINKLKKFDTLKFPKPNKKTTLLSSKDIETN